MLKTASPHGTRREVLATALSMLASPLLAATATTKFVLTNAAWTDLGAGPLLLSFKGDGVYAVSDTVPSLTGGFTRARGGSIPIDTASHVWAMAASANGAAVYAAPIMPGGGPPVTSVWSASDAAANGMTLSNGGLTVTSPATTGFQFDTRNSQPQLRESLCRISRCSYRESDGGMARACRCHL